MHRPGPGRARRVQAGHRGFGGVVHVDEFGRVFRGVRVVGDHHGHRLAHVPDLAARQQRQLGGHELRAFQDRQQRGMIQVSGGKRGVHAGRGQRAGQVDRLHRGGRERAAHERGVQQPGPGDVIGEPAPAEQHPPVLVARYGRAHPGHRLLAWASARSVRVAASFRR